MASTEETSTKTYRGNCQCGAFIFEADIPEVKAVLDCNCSLCSNKGYLFVPPPGVSEPKFIKGSKDALSAYTFNSKMLFHYSCPDCGTALMAATAPGEGAVTLINARVLQGIDTFGVTRIPYDAASKPEPYNTPIHSGEKPHAAGKQIVYTGSCHCGDLTMAVATDPLDETYSGLLTDCECSDCARKGYVWMYPKLENVVFSGEEASIGRHHFGNNIRDKVFCKKCSVFLTSPERPLTESDRAALSDGIRAFVDKTKDIIGVNVRALHGVDLGKLKIAHSNGSKTLPIYVEP